MKVSISSLNIVLPVGISFYTFQTLSYTIDVYRIKLAPTKDFIAFSSFVCFFPQLVAGPIERATNLLPQFHKKRVFDYSQAVNGMRQILWGLVKKVVIADNCAYYVNKIFNNSDDYSGSNLAFGAILFTIQVYGDFSGYSDIAIGTSRLFGFNLKRNFNFPFFSRDISEFWRRWHISLMSWFKDYLYIPLGGGRNGTWVKLRNIFIVFSLSGLWHGANWNFIAWGVVTTIYFIPVLLVEKKTLKPIAIGRTFPNWKELFSILFTFSLVVPSFMFIRVDSIQHAFQMFSDMFSSDLFSIPSFKPFYLISLIIVFFSAEWVGRESQFVLDQIGLTWRRSFRWTMYLSLSIAILWFINKPQEFFYFQF
jgi:D-alanyl-lipoteichoic acid acyltransferase DltB (MBOAT superfamily)